MLCGPNGEAHARSRTISIRRWLTPVSRDYSRGSMSSRATIRREASVRNKRGRRCSTFSQVALRTPEKKAKFLELRNPKRFGSSLATHCCCASRDERRSTKLKEPSIRGRRRRFERCLGCEHYQATTIRLSLRPLCAVDGHLVIATLSAPEEIFLTLTVTSDECFSRRSWTGFCGVARRPSLCPAPANHSE